MGSKSQVRSMQRGAHKRDRAAPSKESDYAGRPPALRPEDRAHLGLTEEASARLASSLKEKILGYARAGFRKPADVSRLLNKEKFRTLAGADWNPRLVHFLLGRIFDDRPAKPSGKNAAAPLPRKENTPRPQACPATGPAPLSSDEMARRLEVLQAHFNREGIRRP